MTYSRHSSVCNRVAAVAAIALLSCAFGAGVAPADEKDPWEGFNRGIFKFNEGAEKYVVGPRNRTPGPGACSWSGCAGRK